MKNNSVYSLSGYVARFAILFALVIVLQLWGGSLKIGTVSFSFVLIPIVFGGMVLGKLAGFLLGFSFGVITFIMGVTGLDPFTLVLFNDHPVYTALICLVKGSAAGFFPAVIYGALSKKNAAAATITAAAAAPMINTGLFIAGALLLVRDTIAANFVDGTTVLYFVVIGCAGVNFLVELGLNLVIAPALVRVVRAVVRNSGRGGAGGENSAGGGQEES